jgi:hypothetical protein
MGLKAQIIEDMKAAMKARDAARLSAIRFLLAAVKQREVDSRIEIDDAGVLAVIEKNLKQRRESFAQFAAAGRQDLADKERFEITVLESYLPAQMTDADIGAAVDEAVREAGATGPKDMGKVMGALKSRLSGRADMGKVSALVKTRLAG